MTTNCPLCFNVANFERADDAFWRIKCTGCCHRGKAYEISGFPVTHRDRGGLIIAIAEELVSGRGLIAGLVAERTIRGQDPPRITPENWAQLAASVETDFVGYVDNLLLNLAEKSSEGGIMTSLSSQLHRSLGYASATDAFVARLAALENDGLIFLQGKREDRPNDLGFSLTYSGWRRVRELRSHGKESVAAFVAMPFREEFDDLFAHGIRPAIAAARFKALRIDGVHHADRIDDRIMAEIKKARFVVADSTGRNPNVLFEAGYALGLGKPVIWTCRKGDHKEQAFDIRQYNHILWEPGQEAELAQRLQAAIENVVGRGPSRDGQQILLVN